MIGKIADGVVGTVRYGYAKKTWLSSAALLLVLALSMGWIMVNALRFNPFVRTYDVKVELQGSGGLLINQDVTYHGVQIGRIEDLTLDPDGVNANVRLESAVKIPAETKVRVSGLSAAGEQFLEPPERVACAEPVIAQALGLEGARFLGRWRQSRRCWHRHDRRTWPPPKARWSRRARRCRPFG